MAVATSSYPKVWPEVIEISDDDENPVDVLDVDCASDHNLEVQQEVDEILVLSPPPPPPAPAVPLQTPPAKRLRLQHEQQHPAIGYSTDINDQGVIPVYMLSDQPACKTSQNQYSPGPSPASQSDDENPVDVLDVDCASDHNLEVQQEVDEILVLPPPPPTAVPLQMPPAKRLRLQHQQQQHPAMGMSNVIDDVNPVYVISSQPACKASQNSPRQSPAANAEFILSGGRYFPYLEQVMVLVRPIPPPPLLAMPLEMSPAERARLQLQQQQHGARKLSTLCDMHERVVSADFMSQSRAWEAPGQLNSPGTPLFAQSDIAVFEEEEIEHILGM